MGDSEDDGSKISEVVGRENQNKKRKENPTIDLSEDEDFYIDDDDEEDDDDENADRSRKRLNQNDKNIQSISSSLPSSSSLSKSQILDGFITSSKPNPKPVHVTEKTIDRSSVFKGTVFRANDKSQLSSILKYFKNVHHRIDLDPGGKPTHNITAWRFLDLKEGSDGLKGPDDFKIQSGFDDDGERWAGSKVLKVMEDQGVLDAVIIVSRWYGGIMLGRSRFQHIEDISKECCKTLKLIEKVEEDLESIKGLDREIVELRLELKLMKSNDKNKSEMIKDLKETDETSSFKNEERSEEVKGKNLKLLLLKEEEEKEENEEYKKILEERDFKRSMKILDSRLKAKSHLEKLIEKTRSK